MKPYFSVTRSSVLGLALCCIVGTTVHAMSVNPVILEMQDSGTKSKAALKVTNDGATEMPVDIKVLRLELDENGSQTTTPADKDFVIFPPRGSAIKPGGAQTFRVQWAGSAPLAKTQTYIIAVNQLPVKFPKAQNGMQLIMNFSAIAAVAPVGATASLEMVSAGIGREENGMRRPQILVENKGARHASLGDATLTLSGGKWSQTFAGPAMRQMLGFGLVQPGKRRRFLIPTALPADVTAVTARIDYPVTTGALSK
jgi:fimbrial chaperone protein